jgi:hypothetical protein
MDEEITVENKRRRLGEITQESWMTVPPSKVKAAYALYQTTITRLSSIHANSIVW